MISLKELRVKLNSKDGFAPKSEDEKRFRDKHKVEVTADRNGNDDKLFKASAVKTFDREKEHGYNVDKDQDVYEDVEQATDSMPFSKPYKTRPAVVTDKSGAKHGPESRVKSLARQALTKLSPKPKGEPITKITPAQGDKVMEEVDEVDEGYYSMRYSMRKSPRTDLSPAQWKKHREQLEKIEQENAAARTAMNKSGHAARQKANEETELDERTLSSSETAEKEKIVKGMKKKMAGFKQRYGERAKSVMYATATKIAKGD